MKTSVIASKMKFKEGTNCIAGTGHRPQKITYQGNNAYDKEVYERLVRLCKAALRHYKPDVVISGMALGFDQALAEAATELEIPWIAAVPFIGQEAAWPEHSQAKYKALLKHASKKVTVCSGGYSPRAMQARNEWMCDSCTILLSLHDGSQGGTDNCIRYMRRTYPDKPIINVWDKWIDKGGSNATNRTTTSTDQDPPALTT